jgi:hypothetical protein
MNLSCRRTLQLATTKFQWSEFIHGRVVLTDLYISLTRSLDCGGANDLKSKKRNKRVSFVSYFRVKRIFEALLPDLGRLVQSAGSNTKLRVCSHETQYRPLGS